MVPDSRDRDVFVSGSEGFINHVRRSLRKLGLTGDQVHAERFAF
jgi:ferredoxin-NADP reductase